MMPELRRIDHSARSRARRSAALKIYSDTILPEAQNPENQILYWIEHGKEKMTNQFNCFAIQDRDKTIGYLQFSYFSHECIMFFEYMCIKADKNQGLGPSKAVGPIRDYLAQNYPIDIKIVFEVARKKSKTGEWRQDTQLIRYFERLGFRTIEFEYRYPVLQSYRGNESYPADLMINLPRGRREVESSELRNILRCVYFGHYLNWDRPFLRADALSERERLIDSLYTRQIAQVDKKDNFDTRGDDNRSIIRNPIRRIAPIMPMINHIFGPKLPRLCSVLAITIALEKLLGSVWLLIPFVLTAAAIYCLAEDTSASRKLFAAVISRLSLIMPRSS